MKLMGSLFVAVAALGIAGAADGRLRGSSDSIGAASAPLPDFSYAGYGFGVAPLPTDPGIIIDVTRYGVIADDDRDDAKAILRALDAARAVAGRVTLRFPQGRIQIGEIIPIDRGELVLDGAGSGLGGTELYFPRPLKIVDTSDREDKLRAYLKRENKLEVQPDQNINFPFSEYSWSGGFLRVGPGKLRAVAYDDGGDKRGAIIAQAMAGRQFTRQLSVSDGAKLRVGQVVQVQWFSVDGPDSAILTSLYGNIDVWNAAQADPARRLTIGSHHWTFRNRPVVVQSTRITAKRGNELTLGDPLLHDVSKSQPAGIADWPHMTNVGIQNMRLAFPDSPWFGHHLEQGYNGIYFTGVFDGWVKNLVIHNADSAILTDNAASLTLADVTTTGERRGHYSIHIGAVHNVLVRNLRVENPVIHPLSVNTRSTRSVYQRAVVLREAAIDQHSGSNHQNLFDQVTLHVIPRKQQGEWAYRLWQGSGASYWKPGHGRHNTHWNFRLVMPDSVPADAQVRLFSGLEGPGARIVGLHGNRGLLADYAPTARIEGTGAPAPYPSLYDHQLAARLSRR